MADLSDVENALLSLIGGIVYPNGPAQPSIVNTGVRIYRGWPIAAQLDTDLAAGLAHVSIYSQRGVETNTTRYAREDQVQTPPVHTLIATVSGNTITLGGTTAAAQNVIVLCGRAAFTYAAAQGDTLASVASGIAALLAPRFPGTSAAGNVVTIAGQPGVVTARIAGFGKVWTEQGRQMRGFQITCWCPTPALRDALAPPIDVALRERDFITLVDQSAARLRYESSVESDDPQKVQLFRRDLFYSVEYATATVTDAPEVGSVGISIAGGVATDPPTVNLNI